MAEYASIRTALSEGTATDADVARAYELKEILAEIDAKITKTRPDWATIPVQQATLYIPDLPRTKSDLSAERKPQRASGVHQVQIAEFPFSRGGVRAAYYARVKANGKGDWKPYVAKQFLEPRHRANPDEYLGQLENNGVLMFLAKEWMKTPQARGKPKIECIESRAIEVSAAGGEGGGGGRVWYHLEKLIDGTFDKWTDNSGKVFEPRENRVLLEFAKWTHDWTRGLMMATDLQGCKSGARGYQLTDPAMICPSQARVRFGPTNFTAAQLEMCLEGVEHGLKAGKSLYPGMKLGSSYRPGFSRHDPEGLGFKAVVDARTARRRRERAAAAATGAGASIPEGFDPDALLDALIRDFPLA